MNNTIIHIITSLDVGGAENSLYKLIASNNLLGYTSIVICLKGKGVFGKKLMREGIKVIYLDLKIYNFLKNIFMLIRLIKKTNPALIQGWMYHGNLLAFLLKRISFAKFKIAWNIRHSLSDVTNEKFLLRQVIFVNKILSRYIDLVIYNSVTSFNQHKKFGFREPHSKVIPNGFSIPKKKDKDDRDEFRNRLGCQRSDIIIGNIARYHPMKGHLKLLEAFLIIHQNIKNIKLLFAGRGVSDGNNELYKRIDNLNLENIILLDEVSNPLDYLDAMDIFCLPSLWGEGFSNILGEAVSIGTLSVASNVGDASLIIGKNGFLYENDDRNANLVNALLKAINLDLNKKKEMVSKARSNFINNYELKKSSQYYLEVYNNLLES